MGAEDMWNLRLLVYGTGEAINGRGELESQIAEQIRRLSSVVTNPHVAGLAQLDSSIRPARRQILDPRGRLPTEEIEHFNAGDPGELLEFVAWADATCPARRTLLALSGHGLAWQDEAAEQVLATRGIRLPPAERAPAVHHPRGLFGTRTDAGLQLTRALLLDGGAFDYLSNAELGSVCEQIRLRLGRPIDVLVFDACLMSSWETLHELTGSAATVVGSLDELSASGIDLASAAVLSTEARGLLDPRQLATAVVDGFSPRAAFDSCVALDIGSSRWTESLRLFADFCSGLLRWTASEERNLVALRGGLVAGRTSLTKYWSGEMSDARSLHESVRSVDRLPRELDTALGDSVSALADCVLSRKVGSDYERALGISIYTPASRTGYLRNRPEYRRLSFARSTGWTDVLDKLFAIS